jgi:hypothetical protein
MLPSRVQYLAVCPDGTSFSWGAPSAPVTITSTNKLKSVSLSGSGIATDNLGQTIRSSSTSRGPRSDRW